MEFKKRNSKIILLSGKARSGKDTVASIIKNYYKDKDVIVISFGHYIKDYVKRISNWDGSESTKPRDLLQQIGIELIKNKIDNKLFIKRVIDDIKVFSYFYDVIVVDDVRLLDELLELKNEYNNSISIRINRVEGYNNLTEAQKKHITETNLDNINDFDYTVLNNNNYNELKDSIENILRSIDNEKSSSN